VRNLTKAFLLMLPTLTVAIHVIWGIHLFVAFLAACATTVATAIAVTVSYGLAELVAYLKRRGAVLDVLLLVYDGKVERLEDGYPEDWGSKRWRNAWIVALTLYRSGRRSVEFENVPREVAKLLKRVWVDRGASVPEVEKAAAELWRLYYTQL